MRCSVGNCDSRDGCYCLRLHGYVEIHVNRYAISERNRDSTSHVNRYAAAHAFGDTMAHALSDTAAHVNRDSTIDGDALPNGYGHSVTDCNAHAVPDRPVGLID
jgi:hypothetical protein